MTSNEGNETLLTRNNSNLVWSIYIIINFHLKKIIAQFNTN